MAGKFNVLLPIHDRTLGGGAVIRPTGKHRHPLIVRLLPIGAVEAWLASGTSVLPLLTVSGTWIEPAGPVASVPPEFTCTVGARRPGKRAADLKRTGIDIQRWRSPAKGSRTAEDHVAVVTARIADVDRGGRDRQRRQGQRLAVGGVDVLDVAGAGQDQGGNAAGPGSRARAPRWPWPPRRRRTARCHRCPCPAPSPLPPKVNPPTVLTGPAAEKSSTEPDCWATRLVLGKLIAGFAMDTNWNPLTAPSVAALPLTLMTSCPPVGDEIRELRVCAGGCDGVGGNVRAGRDHLGHTVDRDRSRLGGVVVLRMTNRLYTSTGRVRPLNVYVPVPTAAAYT